MTTYENGITDTQIDMLFTIAMRCGDRYDRVKNKTKLRKFFKQGGHIIFEKADQTNNTKWFAEARDRGFNDAMNFHRDGTYPTFQWDNYDKWRSSTRLLEVLWDVEGSDLPDSHALRSPFAPCDYHKRYPIAMDTPSKEIKKEIEDEYGSWSDGKLEVKMWRDCECSKEVFEMYDKLRSQCAN